MFQSRHNAKAASVRPDVKTAFFRAAGSLIRASLSFWVFAALGPQVSLRLRIGSPLVSARLAA